MSPLECDYFPPLTFQAGRPCDPEAGEDVVAVTVEAQIGEAVRRVEATGGLCATILA